MQTKPSQSFRTDINVEPALPVSIGGDCAGEPQQTSSGPKGIQSMPRSRSQARRAAIGDGQRGRFSYATTVIHSMLGVSTPLIVRDVLRSRLRQERRNIPRLVAEIRRLRRLLDQRQPGEPSV